MERFIWVVSLLWRSRMKQVALFLCMYIYTRHIYKSVHKVYVSTYLRDCTLINYWCNSASIYICARCFLLLKRFCALLVSPRWMIWVMVLGVCIIFIIHTDSSQNKACLWLEMQRTLGTWTIFLLTYCVARKAEKLVRAQRRGHLGSVCIRAVYFLLKWCY